MGVATVALAAAASPAAPAGSAACRTAGLVVWLDTEGSGAAGSVYYKLELTNLSPGACSLFGYPGVSAIDLRGRQVGSAAARNPMPRRTVTLASGQTATAVLRIAQVVNYPRAVCRPVTAAGLRVYPPNETASKLVPFPFRACSRAGPAFLAVGPVTR